MLRFITFWRVVAVLALGLFAYALFSGDGEPAGPYVARHDLTGIIVLDDDRDALIRDLASDPDAAALLLRIDSPGGTVTGAEALYEAIRKVAEVKPVIAVMGEVAASGGYLAAIAADRIVAHGNTITGSIGVIKQEVDIRGLMDLVGVQVSERRSDVYKARPSPFSATPAQVAEWEDRMIGEAHEWFRGLVGDRRGLEGEALVAVTDGRVFSGRQALERGLIDEIGGLETARAWLVSEGVDAGLPTRKVEKPSEKVSMLRDFLDMKVAGATVLGEMGIGRLTGGVRLLSILR
ncbi:MAG: signal peptide peptidase SppA [Rhodobacteraceae bacterium]|nr:signal peptide peptidase SppA [Paracoccaceae bacterium]MBR27184.1 signal peptide peptidase SppA [Paracoccaceae bacterium]